MIDINQLHMGQACPCGQGFIRSINVLRDEFSCCPASSWPLTTAGHVEHTPMPRGSGFYTNLTNVSVTPARVRVRVSSTVSPPIAPVTAKFPHVCPKCGGACWNGFTNFEHAATGDARCP